MQKEKVELFRSWKVRCVSLFSFVFLEMMNVFASFAQTVEVKIIDSETRESIEFVAVQWKPVGASSFKSGALSNEDGIVMIPVKPRGKYVVQSSYVGYETSTDTVEASEKKRTIRLSSSDQLLAGVTIVGKSKAQIIRETPEAVAVIDAKELQGRSVSLESVLDRSIGCKT
ncbi:MAG: carboxypeptidase-like regulatory domain-containing protein [Paludibacteraceae bacterium]|nr:carboxypeptidase-like regulatory domain-containing protein [Paludibacteraceae bacterium]